ncbi:cutinase-domain-containing protein [Immersiella caudata]|uniref:cutinase n=1 Tax=Immersiella caudata TaxID=314043 RepID=A0AA40BXQ8_9PEZI|nr:cutinase-domain-containing protein [Immersiella caudata]
MKFFFAITTLASLVLAALLAPADTVSVEEILPWKTPLTSSAKQLQKRAVDTRNELQQGGTCPPVTFISAHGSTENGNLGTLGPRVADGLEDYFGASRVWVQCVGGRYTADILDNLLPDETTQAAITEMKNLFILANSKCPSAMTGGVPPLDQRCQGISNTTLFLHAIKIDTVLKTYHQLFSTDLLSQTVTGFVEACFTITQDAIDLTPADSTKLVAGSSLESTPQWKSLIHTLGGLDNRDKLKNHNVDVILERGAEEILALSRKHNENFSPGTCLLGLILNHSQPSGPLRLAKVFITFAWWLMAQRRAPFCTALGRVGLAPACTEIGDEVWLVPGCEIPVLFRVSGCGVRKAVGEVYVDGVNFWEPVGGFRGLDEVRDGEKTG